MREGTWPQNDLRSAFVAGARWWEYYCKAFSMWQSDQRLAEAEAEKRYGSQQLKKGFKMEIKQWQKEVYELAKEKGWWDREHPIPELLCLIHSEVSEALEAYRDGYQEDIAGELADIAIRLFEMAEALKIDLEQEIAKKHEINKNRPYRHGGKVC